MIPVAVPARVTTLLGHIPDGHVTGVVRDSLDVEYVFVHRLERSF
jgi:hypothetical protein